MREHVFVFVHGSETSPQSHSNFTCRNSVLAVHSTMTHQQKVNDYHMVLVQSLMQRLSCLPTVPRLTPLDRGKLHPSRLGHERHLLVKIHIIWCCIDR